MADEELVPSTDADNDVNCMLTTTDNPYNPFTQFNEWYSFDIEKGYNTCGYLARIAKTTEGLSDLDNSLAIERAMDEIVSMNIIGKYVKVTKETFVNRTLKADKQK